MPRNGCRDAASWTKANEMNATRKRAGAGLSFVSWEERPRRLL
jgi:hypothetical protein